MTGWAAYTHHFGAALIVTASVIAWGEPVRLVRWLNVPLGLAVAALPWFLGGGTLAGQIVGAVAGLAVIALTLPRGPRTESYGSWDRFVY